ncbi:MAG: hypothetical protein M0Z48_00485 [Nitrospiraceae bacterium]|nr:hypothetical protein [Nitrospiraceae bacterium]
MPGKCPYAQILKDRFKDFKGVIGAACVGCKGTGCDHQREANWMWDPKEVGLLSSSAVIPAQAGIQ